VVELFTGENIMTQSSKDQGKNLRPVHVKTWDIYYPDIYKIYYPIRIEEELLW
jgi:hypothetical protein